MSINLEEDKVDSLKNTNDLKQLSEQVVKLRTLEDKVAAKEEELKKLKGYGRFIWRGYTYHDDRNEYI